MTSATAQRSRLEQLLAVVTEVRAVEGVTALLMTLNIFLVLTAYYIIKPVREALILDLEGGNNLKAYAGGATAVLFVVAIPIYGALVDRLQRNRLVVGVTLFFVGCLTVFYFLGNIEGVRDNLGIPFYLWVGVFNMMIIAQFWSFANDIYTPEQGKRLFAMVAIGQSVGAALGGGITSLFLDPPDWAPIPQLNVFSLLLVSAALLSVTAVLTQVVHLRERSASTGGSDPSPAPKDQPAKPKPSGGFALVFGNQYLLLIAVFALLFTFVNTNGEYMLSTLASEAAPAKGEMIDGLTRKAWFGSFYGGFYSWVNVIGFLLQTFAVSRIVRFGGMRVAFLLLPIIILGGASLIALFPIMAFLRPSKIIENATDYSLNNTVRQMLWLPTTTEMKYKAKQAVDTFFVRMGDVASALLVGASATFLSLSVRSFAIINVVLAALWLGLAQRIIREEARLSEEVEAKPADR